MQDQTNKTGEGLSEAKGGVDEIQQGLAEATAEIACAKDGLGEITKAMNQIGIGIKDGANQLLAASSR